MTSTPIYNNEYIKSHEEFNKKLADIVSNYSVKDKSLDDEMSNVIYDLPMMGIITQALFITTINQMKQINRLFSILENIPNNKEFEQVKQELEKQRKDSIETLLPIKKLSESLEASKNKKVDYIG